MANVTILGAGAMGSALSTPLRKNGHNVNLWGTHLDTEIIDQLKKDGTHIKHKCKLADGIKYFYNEELEQAMEGADLVIMGITSDGLASVFKKAIPYLKEGMVVGSVSKGFEYDLEQKDKVIILPDILEQLLPEELKGKIPLVFVGGPCKAVEVVWECPNSVDYASKDIEAAKYMRSLLATDKYNVGVTTDVIGLEICAAMKNAYSIGLGMAEGFKELEGKNNNNCKAALFTFAVAEMGVLTKAMGGSYASVIGQPGVGDLEITCEAGRNRILGEVVGAGMPGTKAIKKMRDEDITVEGYNAIKFAWELVAQLEEKGVLKREKLPFLEALYEILYNDAPSYETIVKVMNKCTGFDYE
ncbi:MULTISPECIES: 2-dehydropantoate 2-reductase N-terminal domain-containing protein [Anaerofustis]|uniref:NAD(P)H-dependent glycerol-3-phosphate dehydrogenase n=1 Tax=Anaerofustis TaxID=264995 RepID=UPI001107381D|nr:MULTISPECIES: 2-dehydropantoate 2-reductase N-terminal domain-containing protein [Anaerofustis]MCO8194140.1 NAD(P)-binding domain-containing protein [Anaerofustis sp. NSJ-163]